MINYTNEEIRNGKLAIVSLMKECGIDYTDRVNMLDAIDRRINQEQALACVDFMEETIYDILDHIGVYTPEALIAASVLAACKATEVMK